MQTHSAASSAPARLRTDAEERLFEGSTPPTQGWPTGTQAMSLLHKLASEPASSGDALKLLHELQVHQVELDLQQEQIEQHNRQIAEDRDRYVTLFDLAPMAYVTTDGDGRILQANRLARAWLDLDHATSRDGLLTDLLSPDCRQTLRDALQCLLSGGTAQAVTVRGWREGEAFVMRSAPAPDGRSFLMAFMPSAGL